MATTKRIPIRPNGRSPVSVTKRVSDYAKNENKTTLRVEASPTMIEFGDDRLINYVTRETDEQIYLVSGLNCEPDHAAEQMSATRERMNMRGSRILYHAFQSFPPGTISPEKAHAMGVEFARRRWGDEFEVLIATHLDKEHIHNHFVINAVSFVTGKKLRDKKEDWIADRNVNDEICKEFGEPVLKNANRKMKTSYRKIIREDIDTAILHAKTFEAFENVLRQMGYQLERRGQNLRIKANGMERWVRFSSLGDGYSEEEIFRRLINTNPLDRLRAQTPKRQETFQIRREFVKLDWKKYRSPSLYVRRYLYVRVLRDRYLRYERKHKIRHRPPINLRKELRSFYQNVDELNWLTKNAINTHQDCLLVIERDRQAMQQLIADRKSQYNQLRRCPDEELESTKEKIYQLTRQIQNRRTAIRIGKRLIEKQTSGIEERKNTRTMVLQERIQTCRESWREIQNENPDATKFYTNLLDHLDHQVNPKMDAESTARIERAVSEIEQQRKQQLKGR